MNRPGCYEFPIGTPFREILDEAGGMLPGSELKAFLPGGASTAFMPAKFYDVEMDFEPLEETGNRLGTGAIIVFDQKTCLVGSTLNLIDLFRPGVLWISAPLAGKGCLISGIYWHGWRPEKGKEEFIPMLRQMATHLDQAYCAFAPGAAAPVLGLLNHFEDEIREHINQRQCPFKSASDA